MLIIRSSIHYKMTSLWPACDPVPNKLTGSIHVSRQYFTDANVYLLLKQVFRWAQLGMSRMPGCICRRLSPCTCEYASLCRRHNSKIDTYRCMWCTPIVTQALGRPIDILELVPEMKMRLMVIAEPKGQKL
mmetsp:Transcript_45070/g.103442  ORF Transcript_45070/g.103442 Transcript_45070/m.103442 type:complete len:131 (-) Transcript_45070:62-454(-)